jgi:prophage regulatory protein
MNSPRYLLLREVIERVRLSRSTLYRQMAAGTFPSPYALSENRSGWRESDIDEWCQTREKRGLSAAPGRSRTPSD